MTSDIQFGDVQHAEPNRGVRPDRDAHFHVAPVGQLWHQSQTANSANMESDSSTAQTSGAVDQSVEAGDNFHIDDDGDAFNNGLPRPIMDATPAKGLDDELMIFVDIDVMRDMEAHASSNTSVELGGVLLGYQQTDRDGKPFVVVTDCLRARHYEATKGSFKFTHDTWSQITDERERFHPELEMVGWYHTHPGWSVFLSGMDLFICNNFFNRPLDVALVIDPVAHDRGWFQWTGGDKKVTQQTQGFYLMGSRFRNEEIDYFARLYSNGEKMNFDPRYSEPHSAGGQSVVNITDNRRPVFDIAIIAMISMQFLLMCMLAWKILAPTPEPAVTADDSLALKTQIQHQAYGEVLDRIISAKEGQTGIVEEYASMKTEQARLLANLDGQIVRAEKFASERKKMSEMLKVKDDEVKDLTLKQESAEKKIANLSEKVDALSDGKPIDGFAFKWWYWLVLGLVATAGGVGTFLFGQRNGIRRAYQEVDGGFSPTRTDRQQVRRVLELTDDASDDGQQQ